MHEKYLNTNITVVAYIIQEKKAGQHLEDYFHKVHKPKAKIGF